LFAVGGGNWIWRSGAETVAFVMLELIVPTFGIFGCASPSGSKNFCPFNKILNFRQLSQSLNPSPNNSPTFFN
jgi:hypothetical protein